jgi:hypothetical protein
VFANAKLQRFMNGIPAMQSIPAVKILPRLLRIDAAMNAVKL